MAARKQTHQAVVRSTMGAPKEKGATPAALTGYMMLFVPMAETDPQTVGRLARGARIAEVLVLDPPPSQGTFHLQLAADSANSLSAVDVVATGASVAVGAKTTAAATLLKAWDVERDIVATITNGTGVEELLLAVRVIGDDDGKVDN